MAEEGLFRRALRRVQNFIHWTLPRGQVSPGHLEKKTTRSVKSLRNAHQMADTDSCTSLQIDSHTITSTHVLHEHALFCWPSVQPAQPTEELPVIMGTWKWLRRISDLSSPHGLCCTIFGLGGPSIQKMWPGHGHSYSSLGLRMNQLNYHLLPEKCFAR